MDITVRIEVSGPLLTGKGPEIVQRHLEQFITSTVMYIYPQIKARTPQGVFGAQGGLLGSIQAEVTGKGTPLVKGVIGTAQKYGEVVEKGRRPGKGMPPPGTMVRWLQVKLGLSEREAKRAEYPVRRKIAQKGFDGAQMFEKGLMDNWGWVQTNAAQHGFSIARDLNG